MSNGKFAKRKGIATKTMFMILAVVLIVGISVGGTLAWLTATTGPVTNTFTTSGIDITLTETGATNNANSYKMVPGHTITKDPKATGKAGSEECWLFVKLVESTNFDSYLEYTMADGWDLVTGQTNVYARKVTKDNIGTAFSVLKNDQVTVKGSVTKEQMNALTAATYPTLTVTAYASQLYKSAGEEFSAAEAWTNFSTT